MQHSEKGLLHKGSKAIFNRPLVLILVAIFFLGSLGTGLFSLRVGQNEIRGASFEDPLWTATQLESEYWRFRSTLTDYSIQRGPITHDDFLIRLDILWSRINIYTNNSYAWKYLHDAGPAISTLNNLRQILTEYDERLINLKPGDTALLTELGDKLDELNPRIRDFVILTNVDLTDFRKEKVLQWVSRFDNIMLVMFATILGGLVLIYFLYKQITQTRLLATQAADAEQSMREAKNLADQASQAKSEFLSSMSHELRTPMNAILGMSNLALQTELTEKQRDYIEKLNHSAEGLLGILNDILDFSKIESGKLDIETVTFQIDDVMDSLTRIIGLKASEKSLEIIYKIDPEIPYKLLGDPLRLGQILLNLTNNAVKFTEPGGQILVSVSSLQKNGDKVKLKFSVRDDGIGINLTQQTKLFNPFSQVDSSTTRIYGGTGLGLAISRNLCKMMGGEIWVDSESGKGSTFSFTVNLRCADTETFHARRFSHEWQSRKILLADGNPTSRNILAETLTRFVDVKLVESGPAIIEILQQTKNRPYDVVLIDWKMPDMDGIETIRAIRQNPDLNPIPIIVMVSLYAPDDLHQTINELNAVVLTRPFTISTLLKKIKRLIETDITVPVCIVEVRPIKSESIDQLRGARLLLVEDNEINQDIVIDLLSSADIEVEIANNGQEALDWLEIKTFDGVLMDCQMPVMDGYLATRKIREQDHLRNLPVIALTANAMSDDRDKVIAAGMNDHVSKPFNFDQLFNAMAKWITPGAAQ